MIASMTGLFSRKGVIEKISPNDLQREKIRLQEEEKRNVSRIEKIDGQKRQVFTKGSSPEMSDRQRVILARKIKDLDTYIRQLDGENTRISLRLRTVDQILGVKQREQRLREKGLWKRLATMNPSKLEEELIRISTEQNLEHEQLEIINEILGTGPLAFEGIKEDEDVTRIVEMMRTAGETGQINEALESISEKKTEAVEEA